MQVRIEVETSGLGGLAVQDSGMEFVGKGASPAADLGHLLNCSVNKVRAAYGLPTAPVVADGEAELRTFLAYALRQVGGSEVATRTIQELLNGELTADAALVRHSL